MVCWKLVLPACLVLLYSIIVVGKQVDTSERNSLKKKTKATNGDSSQSLRENISQKTKPLRIKKTRQIRNGFVKTSDLCRDAKTNTLSPECGELRLYFKRRRPLKLRHQQPEETQGATRTLIIVKGKQEISREYIKRHNGFKHVLRALKERLEILKARRKKGLSLSPRDGSAEHIASSGHVKKFPSLYLVRSGSRETEGGKKHKVVSNGDTEVTEVRTSSPEDIRHWEILGTLHTYEVRKKLVSRSRHRVEKLPEPSYEKTPLSELPLYDDRVLKKVTSGLKIFVNDSSEKTQQKHLSRSQESPNAPSSSSGLHDVTSGVSASSGLHDVTSQKTLNDVTPAPSWSSRLHDVTSGEQTSSGLHDFTSGYTTPSGVYDVTSGATTSSSVHDVTSGDTTSSVVHDVTFDDTKLSYNKDDTLSTSASSDVTPGSTSSENDDVSSGSSTTTSNMEVPESGDDSESSISVEELFNDDDTKSSAKIDRLLSDDKTTDALAKEIANLLTDDPASSSENPNWKAPPNDVAIITDDAPIEQKNSPPVTDVTTVSSEEAVSSAQKSPPLTASSASEQCLAKRGLGSTECTISMICCSVCCPLDSCPLKDIFKKQDIPDDCNCERQVVCPGLPNPAPVVPFHSPHPPPHAPFLTFAGSPTSLTWLSPSAGTHGIMPAAVVPPTTPNILPGLVPPSHPAVFVGPGNLQTPTLIRHPALPYQVAHPALSPLNINFHWPPHVIPHNPGFPPLFGPPIYHRPPLYTHPIHPHSPFMTNPIHPHSPFMHPPIIHHHPPFMHPPFMHPHPPFMHPHPPFMHPPMMHPPMMHPPMIHPPMFHPIHFHPPHHHVPVIIHPPPQPVIVHPPPPPPPPKPKPPAPKPISPPKPKPKGAPAPSFSGSDATAGQGNSPGAPPGIPPLVVVGTSKKKSKLPSRWMMAALKRG